MLILPRKYLFILDKVAQLKDHSIKVKTDQGVEDKFNRYPSQAHKKIRDLRLLILEAAEEIDQLTEIEETLKWNEPSYLTKHGSTIRIDWKEKSPEQFAIYFKCTSKLVPSFKKVFGDIFTYEGDRAIVFKMDQKIPSEELKKCIKAGLMYHKVKHLQNLGLEKR